MITVNGNHLRNMPEQISKNTEDILDLQNATNSLDGRVTDLENSIISNITLNNLEVTGNTVIGDANTDTLAVTGASSFNGNVGITGNVTASGSLAAASASFTGNETVSGNLTVNGNITNTLLNNTENVLRGAADVPNDFYSQEGNTGVNIPTSYQSYFLLKYGHWRISNGKLNIVILISSIYDPNDTIVIPALSGEIAAGYGLNIPAYALNKLIPVESSHLVNELKKMQVSYWSATESDISAKISITKTPTNLNLVLAMSAPNSYSISPGNVLTARFEFNFTL